MPPGKTTKAQQRATIKYHAKTYSRVSVLFKKRQKEILVEYLASTGESMNNFIIRATFAQLDIESGGIVKNPDYNQYD